MNKIVLILSVFFISCADTASHGHEATDEHETHGKSAEKETAVLQLNNGAKWKADDATRQNVAALSQVADNSRNEGFANRDRLSAELKSALDTLVKQCKMKGPDHDALHVWLETVMQDVKDLKTVNESEYPEVHARLKKDINSFHDYFA